MNESGHFNETELLETRRIASLRIYVERAMERIKNYHILDFVPITLCRNGIIDDIFCLCNVFKLPPTTCRLLAMTMLFLMNSPLSLGGHFGVLGE